jgi:hypothetical protein
MAAAPNTLEWAARPIAAPCTARNHLGIPSRSESCAPVSGTEGGWSRSSIPRGRRRLFIAALVVMGAAVAATVAWAAFPDTNVETYAGCLNTAGTAGGTITQVAVGVNPLKPCAANSQKLVYLSGGDITKITAGTGLTGGGINGAASGSAWTTARTRTATAST